MQDHTTLSTVDELVTEVRRIFDAQQPAVLGRVYSPDTNILDLGFFNSIQSLQDRTTVSTVDELVTEVRRIFDYCTTMALRAQAV